MAVSIASSALSCTIADRSVANADGQSGEIELAALDLYDAQGRFIERITLTGDQHAISLDLRHLIPHLLARPCAAIILRHRHPSGLAEPSRADIATTRNLAGILRLIGIRLQDHLIEGGRCQFSFRAAGLI